MACKLGGEPWSVRIPMSGSMIIGYDTYHDTLHNVKSVGAVVACINQDLVTKVAVQMNCKLGGEPWSVRIPVSGSMIIGYDTYHDTLHNVKSVGAVVDCINQDCTKFMSIANIHSKPQQELDDLICPVESKALRKYHQLNGSLPQRIIMYRY